jgi:hypothetical protein
MSDAQDDRMTRFSEAERVSLFSTSSGDAECAAGWKRGLRSPEFVLTLVIVGLPSLLSMGQV